MLEVPSYQKATTQLTLREKVGQLFMPAAFINDTEDDIQKLERLIRENDVGGLCFFHSRASAATNFEGAKKIVRNEDSFETLKSLIQRYQKIAEYPLLIAIDAEWGLAMRIENTPQYPYAITLGALADDQTDLIFELGKNIAKDCRAAGIHWNLSPCVDINNNPNNPVIGYRSFGGDRLKVTEKALAYIKGTQSVGILTSIKHFPGHGDTATDSHLELPLIDNSKEALFENELYPFQKLIDEDIDSVMVGHLSVPNLAEGKTGSSSISQEIIKGVLRHRMGWDGVVISDALNMHAVAKNYPMKGELEWLAFDAGNDVLCFAEHIEEGVDTILKNASDEQIEESFKRVWQLKEKVQSSNLPKGGQVQSSKLQNPSKVNRKIALESLTLLKGSEKHISHFKETDFIGISIPPHTDNQFFKCIHKTKKLSIHSLSERRDSKRENILLALFPPQVKPTNNFGFSAEELIFINEIIATKNVMLYLFGNPYVLNHIDFEKSNVVVIAYQDFEVFQETAAEHFLGDFAAKGKLPVKIGS